ncbi:uncharacterized protein YbaA (DUF1428 family) [Dongia mobilis]|uniref:Uncharacterized protein YbaA (DUF1428 family) n=1 Tax=Dongia mobilis TaxID=578943 RepID=A0A4R6WUH6_9PROT|nr:DUF1428 domain-containing protein [Dongia mobilis]TDQ84059.1 uncharacterized protein YbaA (DUF1428 family) [Dongia mobilis]
MAYIDGFVVVCPKKKIDAYRRISRKVGKVWKEYGALDYRECVADDIAVKFGTPFGKLARLKPGETVIFSWIGYKSKRHRDAVNRKVMADPRLASMGPELMPFDMKRMSYGGFQVIVDL